ncbi:hypothetical protein [Actinokineospora globicatena]|uniref:hypothetical protein n=1 Tax=Actinokineospora globicatena TaxID=103729 RepID=UPI0020A33590|nr:hypothetical protein [Actinokineospora globicatena]MCP2306093.1 hypothetical protein [Actinokineospora globicatena]GLW80033.1 hypothetical protein Aglo01_45140 [Actinokineospora globicatena]GLW86862.1 hypothetical protein Aglo02_45010 [Actinokineospora globicatena]
MNTLVRVALAGALIVAPADSITTAALPGFALYVALVITLLFHTSLFRTRLDRTGGHR